MKNMVLGEKLWEGKAKSVGTGLIKYVGTEGVTSEYPWMAQVKGMGHAKGLDGTIHVTAVSVVRPKGVSKAKDQGTFMMASGDMGVLKGFDLMKRGIGGMPSAVGLWMFMATSEKLSWMNDVVALVTFEALDPMWMESNIAIYESK
jgi:hypothetical protein